MEDQGLAAQSQGEQQAGQEAQMQQAVQQIVELLMQGVKPEELIQQGVPHELVMKAVEIVKAQQGQQQADAQAMAPGQDPGLAQRMIQG